MNKTKFDKAVQTCIDDIVSGMVGISGTPSADLSNYYTKEQTNTAISTAIGEINIPNVPTNGDEVSY